MTPTVLKRSLQRLGLSQMEVARRLGVDGRTVRSWVSGAYPVPGAVSLLLDCWLREQRRHTGAHPKAARRPK